MRIPLSWLKKYIDLDISAQAISDVLTLAGLEVDKIEKRHLDFEGVVVAKVLSVAPHPKTERLQIATVSDGTHTLQIVCGAPNCRAGLITALAKIGASLKDEEGKKWKIKDTKIQEVPSFGMLCSEKELGLSENDLAIMELPEDAAIGADLASLYSEEVLEISLTPNLGHCMSVLGVARELSALLNVPLVKFKPNVIEDAKDSIDKLVEIEIVDPNKCKRYCSRILKNITVGPSPHWLKSYLESSGMRSVNNIVDISNFVMLEYGQPLHMFDYDKIAGKKISVTSRAPQKSFVALDEKTYDIPENTLLICDDKSVLAIAGVIGGKESAVTEQTKNILIESAYFTPHGVRGISKRLHLRTEASARFERGVDPSGTLEALERATLLVHELAGGSVVRGLKDVQVGAITPKTIHCRTDRVNQLLGTKLSVREIVDIFKRLDIRVIAEDQSQLKVEAPTYRHDLQEEIDLIEEVARVYGYNNIPRAIPYYSSSTIPHSPIYLLENMVREKLIAQGLQEWTTCDLISPTLANLTLENSLGKEALIHVLYPNSVDQSILRSSLLPGLLATVKSNKDHQNHDMQVFEVGRIHFKIGETYHEPSAAGIILSGKHSPYHWDHKPREVDFYDLKGIVENLLRGFGITNYQFTPSHLHNFHPGRQAAINVGDMRIGVLGEVHPAHLTTLDIAARVLFAEINLQDLALLKKDHIQAPELSLYPSSERDWTITMSENVPVEKVFTLIRQVSSPFLEKVILLDLYKSEQIGKDKKNVTFRFVYRDRQKTISQEIVDKDHAKMTQAVAEKI
jgi:phenylalanyl-tRNA synthetase beta chain